MTRVLYSQCWEDPRTLTEALQVTGEDDVLSIGSAGDNSLALLLHKPRSLAVIDSNPAQIFLIELKIRALQTLDYDDFVGLLGVRPCRRREKLYYLVARSLSGEAKSYWDSHSEDVLRGIIHCGKFENYLAAFRRYLLPLTHGEDAVHELLGAPSLSRQKAIYDKVWNNRRWRLLSRPMLSRFVLGRLARYPLSFRHVSTRNVADELLRRIRRGLKEIPVRDNFFIEYILTGGYRDLESTHPYLSESNFSLLKERVGRIRFIRSGLDEYLASVPSGTYSKFNLSDIFEYMSNVEFERTLRSIARASRRHGRICYWTLFAPRLVPPSLAGPMTPCPSEAVRLFSADRAFFYGGFCLCRLAAEAGDAPRPTISRRGHKPGEAYGL